MGKQAAPPQGGYHTWHLTTIPKAVHEVASHPSLISHLTCLSTKQQPYYSLPQQSKSTSEQVVYSPPASHGVLKGTNDVSPTAATGSPLPVDASSGWDMQRS
eukprot:Trichotokara_eunicae@DN3223_c0_g1_i4.p1